MASWLKLRLWGIMVTTVDHAEICRFKLPKIPLSPARRQGQVGFITVLAVYSAEVQETST
jgi:hypothetical protein